MQRVLQRLTREIEAAQLFCEYGSSRPLSRAGHTPLGMNNRLGEACLCLDLEQAEDQPALLVADAPAQEALLGLRQAGRDGRLLDNRRQLELIDWI